jgi:hypothetical protein
MRSVGRHAFADYQSVGFTTMKKISVAIMTGGDGARRRGP